MEVTSYEYDGLKRLISESVTAGSTTDTYTYKYDDYGNRAEMAVTGSENYTTVYSYSDSQGKYKALLMSESKTSADETPLPGFTTTAEKTTYTYDKNGSQLTKTTSEKTETNTYNAVNQLVGFTDGETTASYAYNASGLRYEKTVDGETVHHVWDGNHQIIADVVESQFYEANCYIRGTNLVATYHYQNGAKSDYTYYVQNAHGDVVNLTDVNGAVTKTYHYDAFGVEKNIVESDVNAFRYCGEYFDAETGTIYLRSRYYNPSIGRFISRDFYAGRIEDPLSLNRYTYCHNNPILYLDPSGNFAEAISDFFSEAQQFISNTWEVAKGYAGNIASSMSYNSGGYAGCGALAASDGPAPILDVIAGIAAITLTAYCVYEGVTTYNDTIVLPNEGALSRTKEKSITFAKSKSIAKDTVVDITKTKTRNKKTQPVYYTAYATYPGATVNMFEPLTLQGAILRARTGGDVYAVTQNDAEILCNEVSKEFGCIGYEGPTNDGYPQNAMHYHPITGDSGIRPHIFYETDPNLKMKLLP